MGKLEVFNISKIIKKRAILNNVSFSIKSNEIVGIIGPNGAGKSTLFKIISGLLTPTNGKVLINDEDIHNNSKSIYNNIGFLIESPTFYDRLTGEENLELILKLHEINSYDYMHKILSLLEMDSFIKQKAGQYSLGMKQRLGIASALVHNPEFILLDEPTNCMDIVGIHQMHELIKKLKDEGKSVIISSHLINEINELCDRIFILKDGCVIDIVEKNKNLLNSKIIITLKLEDRLLQFISSELNLESYNINDKNKNVEIEVENLEIGQITKKINENNFTILKIENKNNELEEYFLNKIGANND